MKNKETQSTPQNFVIYETEDNLAKVSVRLAEETVWLTQKQLAEIFDTTKQNIGQHIKNILGESELDRNSVVKFFFTTAIDGKNYNTEHYNLDNEKVMLGMTNFKGNYITKEDVCIAKNYLSELELQKLNLLTEGFLGYAELQALEQKPMRMNDWKNFLDQQLKMLNKNILSDKGKISHQQAIEKAEKEFEAYRQREMKQLESDFDKAVKRLTQKTE